MGIFALNEKIHLMCVNSSNFENIRIYIKL